ncbi:MAG: CatA-like O-acetyltransferase [Bacilli bacterium]
MGKRIIDIDTWAGKKHYEWFSKYQAPYYGATTTIDLTAFFSYIKEKALPFFPTFMYLVVKALNTIPEFRLRIQNNQVIEYDVIHPAFTVMTDAGIYDNCDVEMQPFSLYLLAIKEKMEATKKGEIPPFNDLMEQRMDQFYISSIPWIDFSSATHPMPGNDFDSVPRILWGKYHEENQKMVISLQIQAHHALIDGYPYSLGVLTIQKMVNNPNQYLV